MEQGGKSSWGNSEVKGIIIIKKSTTADNKPKFEYFAYNCTKSS